MKTEIKGDMSPEKREWLEDVANQWNIIYDYDFNEETGERFLEEFVEDLDEMFEEGVDPYDAATQILFLDDENWEEDLYGNY